jgi:hypothetical protein
MSRLGRYWLFYVIVAVGLALSWGQVGRKTQRALSEAPVTFLTTEGDCRVVLAPCAAVAADRALVLGPGGHGLRLRQTGFEPADIATVEAELLGEDGGEQAPRPLVRDGDGWYLPLPGSARGTVRVRVIDRERVSVADFALR